MNSIIRPFSRTFLKPFSASTVAPLASLSQLAHHNTTTTRKMSSQQSIPPEPKALTALPFVEAVKLRRTVYSLDANSPIPDSQIIQLVKDTVLHVPSSFNSQTTRIVVVLKEDHKKFWDMTTAVHKEATGDDAEKWARYEPRFKMFQAAYGTVCPCANT